MDQRFTISERLKQKRLFDELFKQGERALRHPIMAVWVEAELPTDALAQIGFSAPKKHFKRAVQRNTIKRRLREAFRTQKSALYPALETSGKRLAILFVVLKTDNISYDDLRPKMMLLLQEIARKSNAS